VGVGDTGGMDIPYRLCFGMGGLRTAGDLVARAQMEKKLKLNDAKRYIAQKLGVNIADLSDEYTMKEVREKHDIGLIIALTGYAKGLAAKARIAEICNFKINSLTRFLNKTKM